MCKINQMLWSNPEHFIFRPVFINRQAVVLNINITFFEF